MADPKLLRVGRTRVWEGFVESVTPGAVTIAVWIGIYVLLRGPAPGRSFGGLELASLMGAGVAMAAWAVSRPLFLMGVRNPRIFALVGIIVGGLSLQGVGALAWSNYSGRCEDRFGGELVEMRDPLAPVPELEPGEEPAEPSYEKICAANRSPDSPYLFGTLMRRPWQGLRAEADAPMAAMMLLMGLCGAIAFRDRRLTRSAMGRSMVAGFSLAAAAGSGSALGGKPDEKGRVVACDNRTLWGERCGQLYWAGSIANGEPCSRCGFSFRASPTVTLPVVTLGTDAVDVLNEWERNFSSMEPWLQGKPASRRQGRGPGRWFQLGFFEVPRVLTVAQALALIMERVEDLEAGDDRRRRNALELAKQRASRISAWMWFTPSSTELNEQLAFQPGAEYSLIAATERIGDVLDRHPGNPILQLDVGLVPVRFRFGNKPRQLRENGEPVPPQNNQRVLWVPVRNPHALGDAATTWVPRMEAEALRTWLSVVRRSGADEVDRPDVVPYRWPEERIEGTWKDGLGQVCRLNGPGDGQDDAALTMVRMDWTEQDEPMVSADYGLLGARLDEWEWFEREQIEQLRQGVVVALPEDFDVELVDREGAA